MTDTGKEWISKQAVIELKPEFLNPKVNRETEEQTAIDRAYARGWNSCNTHWIKEINALPSYESMFDNAEVTIYRNDREEEEDD